MTVFYEIELNGTTSRKQISDLRSIPTHFFVRPCKLNITEFSLEILVTNLTMELKKTPQADLENKRSIFFELGLTIAIVACLLSFKSISKIEKTETFGTLEGKALSEELPPIMRVEETKPEPPKVVDLIEIVDNLTEIEGEPIFEESEVNGKTAVYAIPTVESTKEKEIAEEPILIFAEEMPAFPGGEKSLLSFLSKNTKYPAIATETGVTGKVIVNFIVNKDGSISDAKVIRSVDPSLDKEALRVVNSMPMWKPGKQSGQFVRVSYSVPINFVLR